MDELKTPEVGDPAPELSRPTATGGTFELADHRGQWVVVYFYPGRTRRVEPTKRRTSRSTRPTWSP